MQADCCSDILNGKTIVKVNNKVTEPMHGFFSRLTSDASKMQPCFDIMLLTLK